MARRELTCVDKFGRPLVGGVQVVRSCMIAGRYRATIYCRVNSRRISGIGVVEGVYDKIQLASSLNQLTARGEILVQCVNLFTESVEMPAGFMVGRFHSVQEGDVGPSLGDATNDICQPQLGRSGTGPGTCQRLVRSGLPGLCGCGQPDGECRQRLGIEKRDVGPYNPSWRHRLATERSTAKSTAC